jgi:hypothetical protein
MNNWFNYAQEAGRALLWLAKGGDEFMVQAAMIILK